MLYFYTQTLHRILMSPDLGLHDLDNLADLSVGQDQLDRRNVCAEQTIRGCFRVYVDQSWTATAVHNGYTAVDVLLLPAATTTKVVA